MASQASRGHAEALDLGGDLAPGRGAFVRRTTFPAARAEALERRHRLGQRGDAVVHAAPEVAEERVVVRRDVGEAVDDAGHGRLRIAHLAPVWTLGREREGVRRPGGRRFPGP
jgi:hypothetical protein